MIIRRAKSRRLLIGAQVLLEIPSKCVVKDGIFFFQQNIYQNTCGSVSVYDFPTLCWWLFVLSGHLVLGLI